MKIVSLEIINKSWGCIGPNTISQVQTIIRETGQVEISTFKGISEKPIELYECEISGKVIELFFKNLIKDVKILDWKDNYSVEVCDGYHWDVIITFSDGTRKKVQGTVEPPPHGELLEEMIYTILNHEKKPWLL